MAAFADSIGARLVYGVPTADVAAQVSGISAAVQRLVCLDSPPDAFPPGGTDGGVYLPHPFQVLGKKIQGAEIVLMLYCW